MSALPASAVDALVLLIERAVGEEAIKTALKTIATIVGNAADPAKGVLKTSNAGLQKRVLVLEGGEASLDFYSETSTVCLKLGERQPPPMPGLAAASES